MTKSYTMPHHTAAFVCLRQENYSLGGNPARRFQALRRAGHLLVATIVRRGGRPDDVGFRRTWRVLAGRATLAALSTRGGIGGLTGRRFPGRSLPGAG